MKINSIDEIKNVRVHWSESKLINDVMGCNDDDDIEKDLLPLMADKLFTDAAGNVHDGTSDKTCLSVKLETGEMYCTQTKFYLRESTTGLIDLISM